MEGTVFELKISLEINKTIANKNIFILGTRKTKNVASSVLKFSSKFAFMELFSINT